MLLFDCLVRFGLTLPGHVCCLSDYGLAFAGCCLLFDVCCLLMAKCCLFVRLFDFFAARQVQVYSPRKQLLR